MHDHHGKLSAERRRGNDLLRRTGSGGRVLVTRGVWDQGAEFVALALTEVARFDDFSADNDPYGEHDFGSLTLAGDTLFWKIDIYPSDPLHDGASEAAGPFRVLTIMLANEY